MKVLLTSAYEDPEPLATLKRLAAVDRFGTHVTVDDPAQADLILFVENSQYTTDYFYQELRKHPLVRQYRAKTLMYNEQDRPFYVIPGLYVSLNSSLYDPLRQRPAAYIREANQAVVYQRPSSMEPPNLYSFVGASHTAKVRQRLLAVPHPRGIVRDSGDFSIHRLGAAVREQSDVTSLPKEMIDYPKAMQEAKFALCPRGVGRSTFRLYEAMKMGRAPVIIADGWVPPEGPDWEQFAITVSEAAVQDINTILEGLEHTWQERGRLAREAWEEWFAPEVRFHHMVENCKKILEASGGEPDFFKPRLTRHYLYMRARIGADPLIQSIRKLLGT